MSGSGNEQQKLKAFITTVIMTPILVGVIICFLWDEGTFLPGWIVWESKTLYADQEASAIALEHKMVYITKKIENRKEQIWISPRGLKVQDALLCDIDRDGKEELIMLCWKVGRYGKHRPFWVEKDEHKWSQHIFVYGYDDSNIRQKWASSYIGQDVAGMDTKRGADSRVYLLLTDPEGKVSGWIWDSWGFVREDADF